MTSALVVNHLTVAYHNTVILQNMSATVPQGVVAALIGPNGAGKTTFLKAALNIIPRLAGTVFFLGKPYQQMQRHIAYIPQRATVDWHFPATALDIVIMGRYGHLGWLRRPTKQDWLIAHEMLHQVGLGDYAQRSINELSGGQQQRLFVARALAQEASIYLMDEPFAGIDNHSEKIIVDLLHRQRDQGKTIIMVHHDLHTVSHYFDWAVFINRQTIACGPIEQTLTPTTLAQTYGVSLW